VRDCRRRSTTIEDPDLLAEVESLRLALSIVRRVEVRELSGSAGLTAAAAGWLRPLVLFPRDWRSWSRFERRAVLAHELAHIARADYAAGIVAQLGLALHFYHPLVHWIASRLRLQQELAADALGASLAGGRDCYLVALSRMALWSEEKSPAWPARTFLAPGGHLIRRIQMLKEKVQAQDRSVPTAMRVVTLAVLVVVGIATIAFRGLAPAKAAETPAAAAPRAKSNGERFDLSFMSPNAMGVYAVRPAAISRIPGLKSYVDSISAVIDKDLAIGLPKLDLIEQATIEFKLFPRDPIRKQPGRIATGDWMVRTVTDFDWISPIKKLVRAGKTPGELVEVHCEKQSYYKAVGAAILGPDACFYFPDSRTAVCSFHEEHLRRQIQQGSSQCPLFLRGDDWQQVEGGLMAAAIDNKAQRLKLDLLSDDPADLPIAPLLQLATRWVVGLDAAEVLKFRAIATCAGDKQGEALARVSEERIAMARAALDRPIPPGSSEEDPEKRALFRCAKVLLHACRLQRDGAVIDLSAQGKVEPNELAGLLQLLTP
jgi:hypothetical protein